jgi:glycosyltransferase involved in cell wall biosynthesis
MVIGIVTLSFNQASFLTEAIGSVTVSSPHELEYVIVDPGSQDKSREIIANLRGKFSETVLEPDNGPADGLNKGFSRLRHAQVCGYLNSDDRFVPGALDYVCKYFEKNPAIDVLLGGILIIDENGNPSIRGRHAGRVSLTRYAEGTCGFWQQGTFFRRSAFAKTAGFNIENRTCWDAELVIDMMIAGARVAHTDRALGEFRIHQASITGSQNSKLQAAYHLDQKRLAAKIRSAGYRERPALARKTARILHRLNPFRRIADLIVGACGTFPNKRPRTPLARA